MTDYSKLSHEEFVELLEEIMDGKTSADLLQVPGAWEVFSEHFNNDVLELWERKTEEAKET